MKLTNNEELAKTLVTKKIKAQQTEQEILVKDVHPLSYRKGFLRGYQNALDEVIRELMK